MSPLKKKIILAIACLTNFMVVLDIAIVNVALPTIKHDLHLSQSILQWIVIAYGLLLGGFLLLGGRLGDIIGKRKILLTGLGLFTTASLVAGLSHSIQLLLVSRGVQGFGAAMMAPSALSIIASTFTETRERNTALGIFGAVGGTSASVGVIASGLLTDGPGWRWIFFMNVPIGILLMTLAVKFLPKDKKQAHTERFDTVGATTITSGLLLFVYALNKGADYGWGSAATLSLFGGAAALIALFALIESRSKSALLPGRILKNRDMVAADLSALLVFGSFFGFIFLGSLLMQQGFGYSPVKTGVAWLSTSVVAFIAAGATGAKLIGKFGVRQLLLSGVLLLVVAMGLLTRLPVHASYFKDIFPAFILAGITIGLAAPSLQVAAMSKAKAAETGLAAGLVEMMREIGGAIAIASVSTILVTHTKTAATIASPVARQAAVIHGFHLAFVLLAVTAMLGLIVVAISFPKTLAHDVETMPDDEKQEAIAIGETEI